MKIIHLSKAQLNVEAIFKVLETGDDVLLKSLSPNTPSSMPGRPVTFPDRSAFRARISKSGLASQSVIASLRDSERY